MPFFWPYPFYPLFILFLSLPKPPDHPVDNAESMTIQNKGVKVAIGIRVNSMLARLARIFRLPNFYLKSWMFFWELSFLCRKTDVFRQAIFSTSGPLETAHLMF